MNFYTNNCISELKKMLSIEEIKDYQRKCFINFMQENNLKSHTWAKKAGISEATIRHYLSGRNSSMTAVNLELLAQSIKVKINNIIDNCHNSTHNNQTVVNKC